MINFEIFEGIFFYRRRKFLNIYIKEFSINHAARSEMVISYPAVINMDQYNIFLV